MSHRIRALLIAVCSVLHTVPLRAQPADTLARCLRSLKPAAATARVSGNTWDAHTRTLQRDARVIAQLSTQPELRLSIWDYIAATVDQERLDDGALALTQYAATLDSIERRFGVDRSVVVAVWGLESNFGQGLGAYSPLQALATLSCEGRRQTYFRSELFALLRILQAGHMQAEQLRGSWAGAFGHVQFMPSTFERLAVDFDGDGSRDLMHSVPDALASAANYLRNAGWRNGEPWGIEVRLPTVQGKAYSLAGEGRTVVRALSAWSARGFVRVDGTPLVRGPLSNATTAALIAPAGADGPAFLVLRNYNAIFRYNASQSYSLAIGHLADRLRGGAPFVTPWPTDDPGVSRAERREMQRIFIARGHDIGAADGVLRPATLAAVRETQRALGLPVDGRPGQRLLRALRQMPAQTP